MNSPTQICKRWSRTGDATGNAARQRQWAGYPHVGRISPTSLAGWLAMVAVLVSWVLAAASSPADAADWPTGRANPAGTGATADKLSDDLQLQWQYELGGLGFDAGPIIAAGAVFAADHDGNVVALDLHTGKVNWKVTFDAGFVASPAYHEGVLYVGDYEGLLRALDAKDGSDKWSFKAGLEIDASPNFFKDSVLLTSQDGVLYSLRQSDGQLNWKYETGDQLQCGATLAGSRTFLGGCDQHLHVVDVTNGKAIGQPLPIDAPTGSTPSTNDDYVFVPTYAGEIFAFKVGQEDPVWRFRNEKLTSEFKNSVAISGGLVIATSRNKRVFALDVKTGDVKWMEVLRKRSDASPIVAGSRVVVAAGDGRIISFELGTGKIKWMTEVKGNFIGAPAAADGKLVVASDRGTIFCFGSDKPKPQ